VKPQAFCCLPWCGKSFGAPYKRAKIRGEVIEYPEGIDFHHTRGRKNPQGVYICHTCHMAHHDGTRKLLFRNDERQVRLAYRPWRDIVIADEWSAA
jgi:hypothetical protein